MSSINPRTERLLVAQEIGLAIKQLRQVQAAAQDGRGESLALIVARLGEANQRLAEVTDHTRDRLSAALLVQGDDGEEE